jgi:hypothetical protein
MMKKLLLLGSMLAACEPKSPNVSLAPVVDLTKMAGIYEGTIGTDRALRLTVGQRLLSQTVGNYSLLGAQLSLDSGRMLMPYHVQYDGLRHPLFNAFNGAFIIELPFARLQPFLRPDSPLRRPTSPLR